MPRTPGHPKTQCPRPSRPGDGHHTQPQGPSSLQEPCADAAGHLGQLRAQPCRDPVVSEGPQATHWLSNPPTPWTCGRTCLHPHWAQRPVSPGKSIRWDVLPLHHPEKRGPWQERRARASTPTWPPPTALARTNLVDGDALHVHVFVG